MTDVLQSQIDYYDSRAEEYDDFWFRRGAYRLSPALAAQWRADSAETMRFVHDHAVGDVLELAAGTGIFTEQLAAAGCNVHAVDAAPRMLEVNRARTGGTPAVTYEAADLFHWRPRRRYDTVFFGFWLSHVPDDRFASFWSTVADCLAPGGRAVLVDSRPHPDAGDTTRVRIEDRQARGQDFRVVKKYWTPDTLSSALTEIGWAADVTASAHDLILRATTRP